jgi:hypothetical protein
LVRRGWLTPYQVNQLSRGRGDELLLGSYVLMERLGQGGMSPLRNLPLTSLDFTGTKVADLSPLKEIKTLTQINGQPAAEFWKKAAPAK